MRDRLYLLPGCQQHNQGQGVNKGLALGWLAKACAVLQAERRKSTRRIIHPSPPLNRVSCTNLHTHHCKRTSARNAVTRTYSENTQIAWRPTPQKIITVGRDDAVLSLGIKGPTHKLWRRLLGKKFLAHCNCLPPPRYAYRQPLVCGADSQYSVYLSRATHLPSTECQELGAEKH